MEQKLKELQKLITILRNEEGLSDFGVTLLEGWAVGMQWAVNKNCNLQSVSVPLPVKTYTGEIQKMDQLHQTQASLTDQLKVLRVAANRLGLYDAADYIQKGNER